jgi:TatD DNase family protein
MLQWIDTHCHLDACEFAADRAAVRDRARDAGVAHCVLPAVSPQNFDSVRTLAHQGDDGFALGIHPLHTPTADAADLTRLDATLAQFASDPHLVAVGEIGLDGFVPGLDMEHQLICVREQLRLARRHGLPVVLHLRHATDLLLRQLRELGTTGGIAHAFNGSTQQARAYLDQGFKLGLGGAMTYPRALQLRRLAVWLPLEAIVLETDAPDMPPSWLYTPAQLRAEGQPQGRNEPGELPRVAALLAQLRGMEIEVLAEATTRNALQALPRLAGLVGLGT